MVVIVRQILNGMHFSACLRREASTKNIKREEYKFGDRVEIPRGSRAAISVRKEAELLGCKYLSVGRRFINICV